MNEIINLQSIISNFKFQGKAVKAEPYGNGHINDTFCLENELEDGTHKRYILQRMNKDIFLKPVELMENVMGVTSWIRKKIIAAGGDPERETLNVIPSIDGNSYYLDEKGEYWRSYIFIEDATCFDLVENPEDFYNSALSFGNFQRLLADYPAATLHETIVNFHNTVDRMEKFKKAVEADKVGLAGSAKKEIEFVMERANDTRVICDALRDKQIPLRVTHNDTKLNNIMIDNQTGKGLCVIDLDTVMPGSALYDYGDSIRFGASTAAEDEKDLSKVSCDMELFKVYTKGYIEGCGGSLTEHEIMLLPMGAKLMTLECGMRFLTDYLEGDVYFKIHREGHNLDRARTQFKLVADMEQKWDQMMSIVKEYV
ncbi:MAG: aminoglycoside phosphotransferase family protein [Lachnospiraceae bacterium]|nr:aminoglycoside phosphotransferase family protein [Lachnospiraceae bacterium]